MARWASWMVLVAIGGYTAETYAQAPPPRRPLPAPIDREFRQEGGVQQAPPADIRVAPRRFAEAVDNFANAVRRLATSSTTPSDRDVAFAIELFARALEAAPYADTVRVSEVTADMREALEDASLAGPPGSPPVREAYAEALFIGTDALVALAYGPYGYSRDVTSRARRLENTSYAIENDQVLLDRRSFTVALRQSVSVLNAMVNARSEPPRRHRSW
jgi:hypothetical protein